MKVGKENILALTKAIELYVNKKKLTMEEQKERIREFNNKLNIISGIEAKAVRDSAGREIIRSEITFDSCILGKDAAEISEELMNGDTKVYTRDYRKNEGKIEIDIRDVDDAELNIIYIRIVEVIGR